MKFAATESLGRGICWVLAAIDAALGAGATFFPATYLAVVHPGLAAPQYPYDWVVRTGILWLAFFVLELAGALSAAPAKWFFCVALLRLMEVPADVAYGLLARGSTEASRLLILAAPAGNAVAGAALLMVSRVMR
jgi:hypothetical protein